MEQVVYRKTFFSKMVLSGEKAIGQYQTLLDACMTHKNIHTRLSSNYVSITYKRNKVGLIKIGRKNLVLYLALDPKKYMDKYNVEDLSEKKLYEKTPLKFKLSGPITLKRACELLNEAFISVGATETCSCELVDYSEIFYPRDFDTLVREGYIKKYVRKVVDGKRVLVEEVTPEYNVHFTAKLLYEALNQAEDLFIITNTNNWNLNLATKMNRIDANTFDANIKFKEGTKLEFKICRTDSWNDVEKGIWKEEIVNHHYVIVDKDLEVEDLIHNFREF